MVEFGVRSHHLSRREAAEVARMLRARGYRVTAEQCYDYVANLAEWLEPNHAGKRALVERRIALVLEDLGLRWERW